MPETAVTLQDRSEHDPPLTGRVPQPSRDRPSPSIFRDTFCPANYSMSCIHYLSKNSKAHFVRDVPQNLNIEDVKTKLSRETSFKIWTLKLLRHPFALTLGCCDIPLLCHPTALTSLCFDIPLLWHPIALTSLCFHIPLLWHPIALTSLCCDIPLLWHPFAVTFLCSSLCFDIPLLWHPVALTSHCFDIPLLWHPFAVTSHCFDIPLLWHPLAVTSLCCDIPKIRNTEVRLSNVLWSGCTCAPGMQVNTVEYCFFLFQSMGCHRHKADVWLLMCSWSLSCYWTASYAVMAAHAHAAIRWCSCFRDPRMRWRFALSTGGLYRSMWFGSSFLRKPAGQASKLLDRQAGKLFFANVVRD